MLFISSMLLIHKKQPVSKKGGIVYIREIELSCKPKFHIHWWILLYTLESQKLPTFNSSFEFSWGKLPQVSLGVLNTVVSLGVSLWPSKWLLRAPPRPLTLLPLFEPFVNKNLSRPINEKKNNSSLTVAGYWDLSKHCEVFSSLRYKFYNSVLLVPSKIQQNRFFQPKVKLNVKINYLYTTERTLFTSLSSYVTIFKAL